MMNDLLKTYRFALLLGLSAVLAKPSLAQDGEKDDLPETKFEIVRPADRVTKNAIKLSERPEIDYDTLVIPELDYSVIKTKEETEYRVSRIMPARMVGEPLNKLYKHYARAGFGNYTTPLFEFSMSSLRDKDYSAGLHLRHYSSTGKLDDVGFPGFSDNEAKVFASKYYRHYTLKGELDYQRNVVHHYGFDPDSFPQLGRDDIRQRFNYMGADVELSQSSAKKRKWVNKAGLDYYYLNDLYGATEHKAGLDFGLNKDIRKETELFFDLNLEYYNILMNSFEGNNFIPRVKPKFATGGDNWNLMIGANVALDINDSTTSTHFYPLADFDYTLVKDILMFYAGVRGDVQRNSFRSLTNENPFLISDLPLENSNQKFKVFGGLRGVFSSKVTFNLKVSESNTADMPFFVSEVDTGNVIGNRFTVVNDDVRLFHVNGELAYQNGEKLAIMAGLEYFNYTMTDQLKPWYQPEFRGKLTGRYNIGDKFIVNADVYYLHDQFARTFTTDTVAPFITFDSKKLKGMTDVNLGFEYRYSRIWSAFVNVNNIAAFRYNRWNNYPTQRFHFIAGISASF